MNVKEAGYTAEDMALAEKVEHAFEFKTEEGANHVHFKMWGKKFSVAVTKAGELVLAKETV